MKQVISVELSGGKTLSFETGHWAKQAHGSAVVRYGETVVLGTACANTEPRAGIDFFPLTVDYREYTYAGGRFPGGFIKREGRPSEKETLTSRLIDRPIRPLFPEGFKCETQVISFVLSADTENDPDIMAINAASAALTLSDIPFNGPIGGVRVGLVNDQFIINPTYAEQREAKLNITVVGTADAIVMIEAGANEVSEDKVVDAIEFGHAEIKKICAAISDFAAKYGKPTRAFTAPVLDQPYLDALRAKFGAALADACNTEKYQKLESYTKIKALKESVKAEVPEDQPEERVKAGKYFDLLRELVFREEVTKNHRRPDGRAFDQIRPIWTEVGVLPRTHGSAIFTRGETQALVTTTLGTSDDMQRIERFEGETKKRFMLHYNFPPFSVGEVGFLRGAGRREIGHGALAERALTAVLPPDEEFPYAMRVVSDILESNGSSSMASVCGGSLSLMDAGVPLKAPVAGVAMGLVKEGDDYAILTDIAGAEDHYGDMDFKVAGTSEGITALQMDIKIGGITPQIMREALAQAHQGRLYILGKMSESINAGREQVSTHAPRFYTVMIPTDKIRELIGPGGKVIRGIVEATGVKIDVEDNGQVRVSSSDAAAAEKALQMIGDITAVPEVGRTYLGTVTRLAEFGAFVEIIPGTDGLLHISEVAEHRIKDIKDELKEGDQVLVKVLSVEGNRIKLSRKAILKEQRAKLEAEGGLPPAPSESEAPAAPRPERKPRNLEGASATFEGGFEGDDEDGDDEDGGAEGEDGENFNREDTPNEPPTHLNPRPGGPAGAGAGGDPRRRRRRSGGAPRGPRGPRQ
ncbi:MAG: polyribonucleotide nucleotidyltransferase [Terracidiphilus sp.]|nr:polyribonucleotide nucleotidyltransferase [Terracidiphilus sp.]